MQKNKVYNYRSNCDKNRLKDIRIFVDDILRKQNVDEIVTHEIVLAVDEICANLMIHSHNCSPDEYIQLHIHLSKDGTMIIDIVDHGIGFDISKYREPEIHSVIKKRKKGGVGLMLVRRIMDKIEFINQENQNICRMHKKLMNFH